MEDFLYKQGIENCADMEVLKRLFSQTNDMNKLVEHRENDTISYEVKEFIDRRIIEVLREIEIDNLSSWFIQWLEDKSNIYFLIKEQFVIKVQEFYKELQ